MSFDLHDMVLGAAMKYHDEYWKIFKPLWNPEIFVELERIKIAKAIQQSTDGNNPICLPVIIDAMNGESTGLITRIYENAPIGMNVEWMIRQLHDWYKIKKHIPDLSNTVYKLINSKCSDKADVLLSELKSVSEKMYDIRSEKSDCFDMHQTLESTIEKIVNRIEGKDKDNEGITKTTIEKLDNAIVGFKGGRFYVIAARPSVGKTSFATFVCLQAMMQGRRPLFFSNEMSKDEIMEKMISIVSKIPTSSLQRGNLTDYQNAQLHNAINELSKLKILIDEKNGWSLDQLISSVYRHHSRKQCDIVFVDYLQQVRVEKSQTKNEQVSIVSDAMKKLSRDLNIPVIGLAQINREAEKTNGKDIPPSLIHIKDSGSLEQDADVVVILHRPESGCHDTFTQIDLRLAKNRHGSVGMCHLKFHHDICSYTTRQT